jgi:hypothetical protein
MYIIHVNDDSGRTKLSINIDIVILNTIYRILYNHNNI